MSADWISVKDRRPDDGQAVAFVVSTKDTTWEYLHGRVLGGTYSVAWDGFSVPGVTVAASHWMPLPGPPET